MQAKLAVIPGWALHFDEISNNVFNVRLIDKHGRQASSTEAGFENALAKAEEYAYGLEMSINNYPNRFLFDYFLLKLGTAVTYKGGSVAYGSWAIATEGKQLLLEGKDDLFVAKKWSAENQEWTVESIIEVPKLTFMEFKKLVSFLTP